jgi:hypothetical protein
LSTTFPPWLVTTWFCPFRIETSSWCAIRFASFHACWTRGDWIACSAACVANWRTPAATGAENCCTPLGRRCLMTAETSTLA